MVFGRAKVSLKVMSEYPKYHLLLTTVDAYICLALAPGWLYFTV